MFEISVILACIISVILLKIMLNVKFNDIKSLEKRENKELEELSKKFPTDEQICEDILKKLGNENKIKIEKEEEYSSCLFTIFNNTITIGKFQQNYIKLQTIAHECIHSNQNRKTLWGNFILSNIYLIYFIIIAILEILNKLPYANIHILILIFLSIIQYIIRFSLENEAMIKAKFIAKEYIEESNILNKQEEEKLLKEYEEINEIGIPFMNYYLITGNIIKIIIFSLLVLI